MKKILVITGDYWPLPSANGLCLDAILKELHYSDYYAEVVSFSHKDEVLERDYCRIHNHSTNNIHRRSKNIFKNAISFVKVFIDYPLFKKIDRNKIYNSAEKIIKENKIDFAICVQKPSTAGYIGNKLKKKHPDIPFYLYEMDSLTDNADNYIGWKKIFRRRNSRLEKNIYSLFDGIFYLKSHENYYSSGRYNKYLSKMFCVDTPLLEKHLFDMSLNHRNIEKDKQLSLIYSGVLTIESRPPEPFVKFLKELNKHIKTKCFFYSRGNAVDYLKSEETKNPELVCVQDYIPRDELDLKIVSSSMPVSIGENFNEIAFSFPSKIIYYMSFGKPIIHYAINRSDLCVDYLNKYPLSLILFDEDGVEVNVNKFMEFLETINNKKVDFESIEKEFIMNSPRYTTNLLLEHLNKK